MNGIPHRETPDISHGAVCFTFDDTFIPQWIAALSLFEQTETRATFFFTGKVNDTQKEGLLQLQSKGHEIGCHGLKHAKAVATIEAVGLDEYLKSEILPANDELRQAGINLTSFSYPFSQSNDETDAALLKIFRHLRTGTPVKPGQRLKDVQEIFVPVSMIAEKGCLTGVGIDYSGTSLRPDGIEQVCEALERAYERKELVVFYAHNISEIGPGHFLPPTALCKILKFAKALGLPAVTLNELT